MEDGIQDGVEKDEEEEEGICVHEVAKDVVLGVLG